MLAVVTAQQAPRFQSTLPRGERRGEAGAEVVLIDISIHAPTRGATEELPDPGCACWISIHAPTRGATVVGITVVVDIAISIHAPTRGATRRRSGSPLMGYFNPRSHEGSDRDQEVAVVLDHISIHAPTRGATVFAGLALVDGGISIHAPTRGATYVKDAEDKTIEFQSTLPRGERQQFSPKSSLFSQQKLSKIFNLNNKLF